MKEPVKVKLLRMVLPLTVKSLSKVVNWETFKGEAILTAPPAWTVRFLVCKRLSAIRFDRVWIVLAVWIVLGSWRVK